MKAFQTPGMETAIKAMGMEAFFEKSFGAHVDLAKIPAEEHRAYIDDWSRPGALTAMLNWYRATRIEVPAPGEDAKPPLWMHAPFPRLAMPVLIVWGMKDKALLPVQLEGLDALINDLRIVTAEDAGHFITWEKPEVVTDAIRQFIIETPERHGD
jgi:pimeloyl-ACP methyl ester carboxylesterase